MTGTKRKLKMAKMIYCRSDQLCVHLTSTEDRCTYGVGADIRKRRRYDHDDHKAKEPIATGSNCIHFRSASDRRDFRTVQKGTSDPRKAKEGVEKE